ncbi:MAG: PAS domain-containing protein [Deltaproteobacteria bacterium]|nr:PAS domain-containing protein [Deltaproteobacteria bacterium]
MASENHQAARHSLDWSSVARLIGELSRVPMVVLDECGRVQHLSSAAEAALGWSREAIQGSEFFARLSPVSAASARSWLQEAFLGIHRRHTFEATTPDARTLHVAIEANPFGVPGQRGLLVLVESASEVQLAPETDRAVDFEYRVSIVPAEFGSLLSRSDGGRVAFGSKQQRCHQAIFGRDSRCTDCPLKNPDEPWPRVAVRVETDSQRFIKVLHASSRGPTEAQISVRSLPETTYGALQEARIRQLAAQAKLSGREHDILKYLLMGRAVQDIATILGITRRTVRFHQQNVLTKLGADSRLDLMRLIL